MLLETSKSKRGYVYVLHSARCDCIKIGGTDYPPLKRIKEINTTEPYKSFGIWTLADFRQVEDWRAVVKCPRCNRGTIHRVIVVRFLLEARNVL